LDLQHPGHDERDAANEQLGQVDSGPFTDGVFTFTDLNATNHVQRYYRMVTQIQ